MSDKDNYTKPKRAVRDYLRGYDWEKSKPIDLHKLGIHYFDSSYLPVYMTPEKYSEYYNSGVTPPMALPEYQTHTRESVKSFLKENEGLLELNASAYHTQWVNTQSSEDFDNKPVRVCILRLSPSEVMDGSFGSFMVSEYIEEYSDDIFIDHAFFWEESDLPLLLRNDIPITGVISRQPLAEFDIILVVSVFPPDRLNFPIALQRSGIPINKHERLNVSGDHDYNSPLVAVVGLGASFPETMFGDHPELGYGWNSLVDFAMIGEGFLMDLQLCQLYREVKGSLPADTSKLTINTIFLSHLETIKIDGVYNPNAVAHTYYDKISVLEANDGTTTEHVLKNGGSIKTVFHIDPAKNIKIPLLGEGSLSEKEVRDANDIYHEKIRGREYEKDLANQFVKTGARYTHGEDFWDRLGDGVLEAPKIEIDLG